MSTLEPGTRIELISMPQEPHPVPSGSRGTVRTSNAYQVWVTWDNGRGLALLPDVDDFRVLTDDEVEQEAGR